MGRRRQFLFGMLVLAFLLGACRQEPVELALPVDDDTSITTDRERYTPEDFGDYVRYTIEVTYTNTTGASVYLAPCSSTPPPPHYWLEHFDGDSWGYGYTGFCNSGPGTPPATEVEAGETFTDTLTLDAYRIANRYPQLGTDFVTGVSRFVFDVVASVDDEGIANYDPLPLEQRVSNAFELRAP